MKCKQTKIKNIERDFRAQWKVKSKINAGFYVNNDKMLSDWVQTSTCFSELKKFVKAISLYKYFMKSIDYSKMHFKIPRKHLIFYEIWSLWKVFLKQNCFAPVFNFQRKIQIYLTHDRSRCDRMGQACSNL